MAEQSPCHIPDVKFSTIFQKSLARLNENRYLPPIFERSAHKTQIRKEIDAFVKEP
jgi:hypothetical protein